MPFGRLASSHFVFGFASRLAGDEEKEQSGPKGPKGPRCQRGRKALWLSDREVFLSVPLGTDQSRRVKGGPKGLSDSNVRNILRRPSAFYVNILRPASFAQRARAERRLPFGALRKKGGGAYIANGCFILKQRGTYVPRCFKIKQAPPGLLCLKKIFVPLGGVILSVPLLSCPSFSIPLLSLKAPEGAKGSEPLRLPRCFRQSRRCEGPLGIYCRYDAHNCLKALGVTKKRRNICPKG